MKNYGSLLMGITLAIGGAVQIASAQPLICPTGETATPVTGTISNNALGPGSTLGSVHLMLGSKKMTCGILGQGTIGANDTINYVHTLVCDDSVELPTTGDTVHSQLTLNTSGFANVQACPSAYPPGSVEGTFQETSVPRANTGRGVFAGVTVGQVQIHGSINCLSSLNMTFAGEVCLKPTL